MNGHIDEARSNDYVEGILTEDSTREVEAHLAACEECRDSIFAPFPPPMASKGHCAMNCNFPGYRTYPEFRSAEPHRITGFVGR